MYKLIKVSKKNDSKWLILIFILINLVKFESVQILILYVSFFDE